MASCSRRPPVPAPPPPVPIVVPPPPLPPPGQLQAAAAVCLLRGHDADCAAGCCNATVAAAAVVVALAAVGCSEVAPLFPATRRKEDGALSKYQVGDEAVLSFALPAVSVGPGVHTAEIGLRARNEQRREPVVLLDVDLEIDYKCAGNMVAAAAPMAARL